MGWQLQRRLILAGFVAAATILVFVGWETHRDTLGVDEAADLPVFVLTSKHLSQEEQNYLRTHAESLLHKQQPWQEALLKELERVVALGAPEKA